MTQQAMAHQLQSDDNQGTQGRQLTEMAAGQQDPSVEVEAPSPGQKNPWQQKNREGTFFGPQQQKR
jgi:hypothetical protein